MIPEEIARKVHLIEVFSTKVVDEMLAGEYRSVFKGHGTEFEEVREYAPGDEFRAIDWNVTARRGHHYIKRYREEREQTVFLLADLSASGAFGSAGKTKAVVIAEIAALLALSAAGNNDRVGLLIFTDEVEFFLPPARGRTHALHLVTELLRFRPRRVGTDIARALDDYARLVPRRGIVFLLSDFQDVGFEKSLRQVASRHDLIAVPVLDPLESRFPEAGLVELRDGETGKVFLADGASPGFRAAYEAAASARRATLSAQFAGCGVDEIAVRTDGDYVTAIGRFFRSREERRFYALAR